MLAQRFNELKTIHIGHEQIGQQDLGLNDRHVQQSLHGRGVHDHIQRVLPTVKIVLVHEPRIFIVFDDQNPQFGFGFVAGFGKHAMGHLVLLDRLQRDPTMPALRFPRFEAAGFNQTLHGTHRDP